MGSKPDFGEGGSAMHGTGQDQQRAPHPLEPLTEEEVRRTAAIVRAHPGFADGSTFVSTALREPGRAEMADYELAGRPPARESKAVLYDRSARLVTEAVISLTDGKVRAWHPVPGVRPKTSRREFKAAVEAIKADPRWQEAMRSRGVSDFSYVEVQPWPPGFTDERDAGFRARVA